MIHQFSQNFINQCLKCNRNVDKFKKHNYILEVIITNAKRRYSFIVFTYSNLTIRIFKIEFNKVNNAYQAI